MSKAYGYSAYGGPENEIWFDRPEPTPGPSELVIKVHAIGVNPVDFKVRAGMRADPAATPAFPMVLGSEAAGTVTAVGGDVEGFTVGDEVMGRAAPEHGTYAEHAVLLAASTAHKPVHLDFVAAAALPVAGSSAWEALDRVKVHAGDTVLINGIGGGVGVMAAQLARDRGAAVIGIGSEAKRRLTESLGAALVTHDNGDVAARVRELLPDGPNVLIDLVGGNALNAVANLVGDPARIVSIVDPGVEALGGTFLISTGAGLEPVAELVATGKADPKVLQTYPFDEAPTALRAVESGHTLGKVVIDLNRTTRT
jgi:NADPH2:quinone reductase